MASGLSFMLIPLYTHYLSTAEYGVLEFLDLTTIMVGTILAVGIAQAMVRYYYEYEDKIQKAQVVSGALIITGVISIVAMPALIWFSSDISSLVLDTNEYSRYFVIAFITMAIGLINSIPATLMRIKEQSTLYVIFSSIKLLITLSLNILFIVYYDMGVLGILWSGLISGVLGGLFLAGYTLRQIKISWSTEVSKAMLGYSYPLVWSWLAMFVMNYGDRFLLQKYCSLDEVGIYALAYKFGMIANVLILSPFLMTWRPKQFAIIRNEDAKETYSHVFTYFMLAFVYCSLGIAILVKDVIDIMAETEYFSAHLYVPILLLSYISFGIYNYVQFGVHVAKKTKYLGMVTITAAVVNISLNLLLTPKFGIWGATISTLASFVLLPIIIFPIAQSLYHIPYQYGRIVRLLATAFVLFYLSTLIDMGYAPYNIALKFLLALSFPLVLVLTKFYTGREKSKLAEVKQLVLGSIRERLKSGKN